LPVTITTAFWPKATAIEQQRKVFRNPRGQKYYYALIASGEISIDDHYQYQLWKSPDGSSWTLDRNFEKARTGSLTLWEDSTNNRLIIWIVLQEWGVITVYCLEIPDTTDSSTELWWDFVAGATDKDVHYPAICLAENGYLWLSWTDEYKSAGAERCDVLVACSTTTYPTSLPTWTAPVIAWDGSGYKSNAYLAKSEMVPITDGVGIACLYYDGADFNLSGKRGSYSGTGNPSFGTEVSLYYAETSMLSSLVVSNGIAFCIVLEAVTPAIVCRKWDIINENATAFGTPFSGTAESLALSIDKTAEPDLLYAFYIKSGVAGQVFYKTSPVNVESWSAENTIDDNTETLDYLSASSQDWNQDGKVQIIYTRQTSNDVRFVEIPIVLITTVYKILSSIYSVIAFQIIGKLLDLRADIFNSVVRRLSILFELFKLVLGQISLKYSLTALVRKISELVWTLFETKARRLGFLYSLKTLLPKSFNFVYSIIQKISRPLALKFDLISIVQRSLDMLYSLFLKIKRTLGILYSGLELAKKSLSFIYTVIAIEIIAKILALRASLLEFSAKTLSQIYKIYSIKIKSLAIEFDIRGLVSKITQVLYSNLEKAWNYLGLRFNLRTLAGKLFSTIYLLKKLALRSLVLTYDLREWISKALIQKYKLYRFVEKTINFFYSINVVIQKSLVGVWNLREIISRPLASIWAIRELVSKLSIFIYKIRAQISKTIILVYVLREVISKYLVSIYNLFEKILAILALKYNLFEITAKAFSLVFSLFETKLKETELIYGLRISISKIFEVLYSVYMLVPRELISRYLIRKFVRRIYSLIWDLREVTFKILGLIFDLKAKALKNLDLRFRIYSLVQKQISYQYNLLIKIATVLKTQWMLFVLSLRRLTIVYSGFEKIWEIISFKYLFEAVERIWKTLVLNYSSRTLIEKLLGISYYLPIWYVSMILRIAKGLGIPIAYSREKRKLILIIE